jgi:predicted Fe-Mo cluster-binding NifX family protein
MKIAVVTDDEKRVSTHFGRARYFLVFTVADGKVANPERRFKPAHQCGHRHAHGGRTNALEHGFGAGDAGAHHTMAEAIRDCQVVLTRGMGRGAYLDLQQAGIRPIVTRLPLIEDAVNATIDGSIENHLERLH